MTITNIVFHSDKAIAIQIIAFLQDFQLIKRELEAENFLSK